MAVCPMCIRIYSALLIVCTFGFNLRSTDATLADHFRVGEYPNCSILFVFISLNNYIWIMTTSRKVQIYLDS